MQDNSQNSEEVKYILHTCGPIINISTITLSVFTGTFAIILELN